MLTAAVLLALAAPPADPPLVIEPAAAWRARERNRALFDEEYPDRLVEVECFGIDGIKKDPGGTRTVVAGVGRINEAVFATLSPAAVAAALKFDRGSRFLVRGRFRSVHVHETYGCVVTLDRAELLPVPDYAPEELAELARRRARGR